MVRCTLESRCACALLVILHALAGETHAVRISAGAGTGPRSTAATRQLRKRISAPLAMQNPQDGGATPASEAHGAWKKCHSLPQMIRPSRTDVSPATVAEFVAPAGVLPASPIDTRFFNPLDVPVDGNVSASDCSTEESDTVPEEEEVQHVKPSPTPGAKKRPEPLTKLVITAGAKKRPQKLVITKSSTNVLEESDSEVDARCPLRFPYLTANVDAALREKGVGKEVLPVEFQSQEFVGTLLFNTPEHVKGYVIEEKLGSGKHGRVDRFALTSAGRLLNGSGEESVLLFDEATVERAEDRLIAVKTVDNEIDAPGPAHEVMMTLKARGEFVPESERNPNPHVIRPLAYVNDDQRRGEAHIALELCSGGALGSEGEAGAGQLNATPRTSRKFAPAVGIEIALQLLAGLGAMHANGVMHNDLKPGNVLLKNDISHLTTTNVDVLAQTVDVKIADFGIAEDMQGQSVEEFTSSTFAGTLSYMSPRKLGSRGYTASTDVFAMGLVLFEVFTGQRLLDLLLNGRRQDHWNVLDAYTNVAHKPDARALIKEHITDNLRLKHLKNGKAVENFLLAALDEDADPTGEGLLDEHEASLLALQHELLSAQRRCERFFKQGPALRGGERRC